MPRLLLALAALAAVAAVSLAAPSTEQLMESLLKKLEKRHEAGAHGHTHAEFAAHKQTALAVCEVCEMIMTEVENYVSSKSTEDEIKRALDRVCHLLPRKFESECDALLETYEDQIIHLLIIELSPPTICKELGLCSSQEKVATTAEEWSNDRLADVELREPKAVPKELKREAADERRRGEFPRGRAGDWAYANYVAHTVHKFMKVRVTSDNYQDRGLHADDEVRVMDVDTSESMAQLLLERTGGMGQLWVDACYVDIIWPN